MEWTLAGEPLDHRTRFVAAAADEEGLSRELVMRPVGAADELVLEAAADRVERLTDVVGAGVARPVVEGV